MGMALTYYCSEFRLKWVLKLEVEVFSLAVLMNRISSKFCKNLGKNFLSALSFQFLS